MSMMTPLIELRELQFGITSLAVGHAPGSYADANAKNAARGINARLAWVIATLEAAKEGRTNMGITPTYKAAP